MGPIIKIMIGGDFNLSLGSLDKTNIKCHKSKSQIKIQEMMDTYDLIDIWRNNNPETRRYTWRRRKPTLTQSRLEYWIIGADMSFNISKCDIKPSIKTDHSLITLDLLSAPHNKRGSGLWKFNAALLSDLDYVEYMKGIIEMNCTKYTELTDLSLKWELIKMAIRKATIDYSKVQANLTKEHENNLMADYIKSTIDLEKDYSEQAELKHVQTKYEIEKINSIKAEGQRIRSKANFIEYNEKGSKYFINLEKRNANLKNITCLKLSDDSEVTDDKLILKELANFYEDLYKETTYSDTYENSFFTNNVPKIKIDDKILCDRVIEMQECTAAIKNMNKNKSPGTDGLTAEFYQYFWQEIKELVHNSLLKAFEKKNLSCEQKRGVLRLIPKKSKNLCSIKNWRPISLLNTDYKILTHVLSNRLQSILPSIISKDQSGYIKNRNISLNIRSIFDIIDHVEKTNSSGLLAFIDFEKAFDKLNWTYIQKSLEQFGFGEVFKEWVVIIYSNIESCIINNGVTTRYFPIKSGIRQGCPLSALLFVIAVELLSISIKNNNEIRGFKVGEENFKITQLADDTTLFLKDIDSLKTIINLLHDFKYTSKLKLNESQTEILQTGVPLTVNYSLFKLKWERERVYALGTWFYKDYSQSITHTYDQRLELLRTTLNAWARRKLTWLGKITVLKTLCISKLNYAFTTIEAPDNFIQSAKEMFENFLWSNKQARVKNDVMYNDYDQGGLRMPNLNCIITAQKINWIKRLLDNKETLPYAYISTFLNMPIECFLKCNPSVDSLPKTLPQFYTDIFLAWFSLKHEPLTIRDVKREIIWNNKFIQIDKKSLFNKSLYDNGMIFINDFIDDNGKFLTYQSLVDTFGPFITNYDYICLKDAVPKSWRKILTSETTIIMEPNNEAIFLTLNKYSKPVKLVKSKEVYWMLNKLRTSTPNCIKTWFDKYFIDFSEVKWKHLFILARSISLNTKLIEFQFKILHRVYPTDSYVSNFDRTVSKTCRHCHVDSNIPHLFVDCIKVNDFWKALQIWIHNIDQLLPVLSTADIIFGIPKNSAFKLNFIVLHAKWFIHLQKQDDHNVCMNKFHVYLKSIIEVEKEIAINRKDMNTFDNHLQPIYISLN